MYNDILASIKLGSPTTSQETRRVNGHKGYNQGQEVQVVNTPIRSSANSLIALGKHVSILRQRKIWKLRNNSPLGGKGQSTKGSNMEYYT